jgi:hypothetical protein
VQAFGQLGQLPLSRADSVIGCTPDSIELRGLLRVPVSLGPQLIAQQAYRSESRRQVLPLLSDARSSALGLTRSRDSFAVANISFGTGAADGLGLGLGRRPQFLGLAEPCLDVPSLIFESRLALCERLTLFTNSVDYRVEFFAWLGHRSRLFGKQAVAGVQLCLTAVQLCLTLLKRGGVLTRLLEEFLGGTLGFVELLPLFLEMLPLFFEPGFVLPEPFDAGVDAAFRFVQRLLLELDFRRSGFQFIGPWFKLSRQLFEPIPLFSELAGALAKALA